MAKVIEFYIPQNFRPKPEWLRSDQSGKLIELPTAVKKSA